MLELRRCTLTFTLISLVMVSTQAKMSVYGPTELLHIFKEANRSTTIPHQTTNFGHIAYGSTIIGQAVYINSSIACESAAIHDQIFNKHNKDNHFNPIVITDDIGCHFITKALNVEQAGAKFLIIASSKGSDEISTQEMQDNGQGSNVKIPIILIGKEDNDLIKNYIKSTAETSEQESNSDENRNKNVTLLFSFNMRKNPNNTVVYELWLSSSDPQSYKLVKGIMEYDRKFGDLAVMTPHYFVWHDLDDSNCLSNGKYCAPDPDGSGPLDGRSVVREDLRQLCIFNLYPAKWWEYCISYLTECLPMSNENCYFDVYKKINLAESERREVQNCMTESFNGGDEGVHDNTILAQEKKRLAEGNIHSWPTIVINKVHYKGSLEPYEDLFSAMCQAFDQKPSVCLPVNEAPVQFLPIIFTAIIMIILLLLVLFFYRRMMRREMTKAMNQEMNLMVSQYFNIVDNSSSQRPHSELA